MDTLTHRGRVIRITVTLVVAAAVLFGALWGQDDLFPFGPFRMYSTADKLNSPVDDVRFELIDTTGATIELTQYNTGIRRAEIEGQIGRFEADPALLSVVDAAYVSLNPNAPAAVTLQIIDRLHYLKGGIETGQYLDRTMATWSPPAGTK
jgi:hypothetical protein